MKNLLIMCVLAALAGCASGPAVRMGKGRMGKPELVANSPFDLEIGSTEYGKMLGNGLRSSTTARYDPETKVTTTNWKWHASCKLAKPYFGCTRASLSFMDEDCYLHRVSFDNSGMGNGNSSGPMTFGECRKAMKKIADDIERRYGITMKLVYEMDEEDAVKKAKEMNKGFDDDFIAHGTVAFIVIHGNREVDGMNVSYNVSGMCGSDRMCYLTVDIFGFRPKPEVVDPVVAKRRKEAHDAAAKLRETVEKLFDFYFGAPAITGFGSGSGGKGAGSWTKLENPCEGMTERREFFSSTFLVAGIPVASLGLRKAYDGDVSEEELRSVASGFLARLEKAYGGKLPPSDDEEAKKKFADAFGDGVPAFGDTRAFLQLDRRNHFMGRVGDMTVEISYAAPQYAKSGDAFEVVRKGAVLVNFLQSPLVIEEKK